MKNISSKNDNRMVFKGLLSLFIIGLVSCNSKEKSDTAATEIAIENSAPDEVAVTETQFTSGAMELGKVSMQEFTTVVKANGMFAVTPENQADVSAYFAGYVKNIRLRNMCKYNKIF
ncbi:hypothetical protein LCGC14_1087090 [marine sediment metagenome]|uniref:Uncharacterized protein n=1 Tax=marine sediment metagenome TaxID=412755 RepID=A0A0F9QJH2_9ZZZZ